MLARATRSATAPTIAPLRLLLLADPAAAASAAPPRSFTTLSRPPHPFLRLGTPPRKFRPRSRLPAEQRHAFTATSTNLRTVCLTEPKLDMGGNEMKIEITPQAGQRLSEIIKATNDPGFALRIRVDSGGCHGFQYATSNETLADPASIGEDECVFRYVDDGAAEGVEKSGKGFEGPKVILDEGSLLALQGSKVDFVQELIGSKFEVVDNPGAENSCGCGSSFSLKL